MNSTDNHFLGTLTFEFPGSLKRSRDGPGIRFSPRFCSPRSDASGWSKARRLRVGLLTNLTRERGPGAFEPADASQVRPAGNFLHFPRGSRTIVERRQTTSCPDCRY